MSGITIAYGTSSTHDLTKALDAFIRDNNILVCFKGMKGPEWEGEWAKARWEDAMEKARFKPLKILLRLVLVSEEYFRWFLIYQLLFLSV